MEREKTFWLLMLSFLAKRTNATLPGFLLTGIQELKNLYEYYPKNNLNYCRTYRMLSRGTASQFIIANHYLVVRTKLSLL